MNRAVFSGSAKVGLTSHNRTRTPDGEQPEGIPIRERGTPLGAHERVRESEEELNIMTNRLRKEGCSGGRCVQG
jgi:hypothetical protein